MHVLRLRLKTTEYQKQQLEKRFHCIWHIHNVIVKYAQKQLNKLWHDMEYINSAKQYRLNKDAVKKNSSLKSEMDEANKLLARQMNSLIRKYHLVRNDLEKFAKVQAKKFSHLVSSQQVQKEVFRIFSGIEKVLYGDGKNIHLKKLRDTDTISGKSPTNGIRYYDRFHKGYYPKKIKPIYDSEIEYLGLQIHVDTDYSLRYIQDSFNGDISYCELKRILFDDGYHYYVNLYIKGSAPNKAGFTPSNEEQGMDLGISTVAAVSDSAAILEELAPESKKYEAAIKKLQKRIDVSRRISNPDNFNSDGTCRKGHLTWNLSNNCRKEIRRVSVLYRKKTSYVEHSHYVLAKRILENGIKIYTEKMEFRGLQRRSKKTERRAVATEIRQADGSVRQVRKYKRKKRFGHVLSNRAPSKLLGILRLKAEQYGGFVKEVDTYSFKASQYRHDTDTCEKTTLRQRFKTVNNHIVQRDLYSAFLLRNTNSDYSAADRSQCISKFPYFVNVTDKLISSMKEHGISMPACFGF